MSGGSSDKQTTEPPKWARPYFQDFLQASQRVAGQAYQPYTGQRVAQANPYEVQGYNAQAQRAIQGSAVNGAAQKEVTDTLSGKYLGEGNPYMAKQIELAGNDVNNSMDMVAARSGSFGNTGVEYTRQKALADSANGIRYDNYGAERGRMQNALGMAPGIANQDYVDADRLTGAGAAFRGFQQANNNDDYDRFLEARNYPREQLGILGQGLGQQYGSTSNARSGSNPTNQLIGGTSAVLGGK
jgi:hypothetical protein